MAAPVPTRYHDLSLGNHNRQLLAAKKLAHQHQITALNRQVFTGQQGIGLGNIDGGRSQDRRPGGNIMGQVRKRHLA